MTYKKTYCLLDLGCEPRSFHGFRAALRHFVNEHELEKVTKMTWEPNTEYPHDGYLFDLTIETE